jgi:transaldolase
MGMVDGVTTNPSLIAKEGRVFEDVIKEICEIVDGPISAEVISLEAEGMVSEARELAKINENRGHQGAHDRGWAQGHPAACRGEHQDQRHTGFSPLQALMAAKAGATYVSPFVGRLDDLSQDGMQLIEQIAEIFANYAYDTEIIVASIRNPLHVLDAALAGADIATIPFSVLSKLAAHPLTDKGIRRFFGRLGQSQRNNK